MTRLLIRWDVTETYSAEVEIDDYDGDPSSIDTDVLAEHETNESYEGTPDRDIAEVTVVNDELFHTGKHEIDAENEEAAHQRAINIDEFEALAPTDQRASYLDEGDIFVEYGLDDVRVVAIRDDHGDTILITDTEGVESTFDIDEVLLVHRPKKGA